LGRASFGEGDESRDYFVTTWHEQEDNRVGEDDFRQTGLQGNARIPLGGTELRLTGRVTSWENTDYPEASGGPTYGTGETRHSNDDEFSFGVEWLVGRAEARQKIYAKGYCHDLDRDSPMIPPGPSGFIPASSEQSEFTSWRLGWAVPRLEAGRAQIGFGVELEYEDGESESTLALPPPFSDGSYSLDRFIGGTFVELLAERGPLLFELGARLDVPEGFDTELSPRAGIRYRLPNETTRLHASVGRAFKLPSFFALANPIVGNPDLDPEVVIGADVGVDHAFAERRVDLSLTLFFNRYEDLVDFDFGTLRNVNDTFESRGVETAVGWAPTGDIDVAANVTWQELDRASSDEPVRQRPEWYGGLRFSWRPLERARWEVDGQWVSVRNDEQIPTGPGTVAGYQLYGTAFSYTVGGEWEMRARIDNLADKDYETFVGFPGAGRSFLVGLRRVR
jgi:outer membrane receptor protein involved in Fe transport